MMPLGRFWVYNKVGQEKEPKPMHVDGPPRALLDSRSAGQARGCGRWDVSTLEGGGIRPPVGHHDGSGEYGRVSIACLGRYFAVMTELMGRVRVPGVREL